MNTEIERSEGNKIVQIIYLSDFVVAHVEVLQFLKSQQTGYGCQLIISYVEELIRKSNF